MPHQSQPKNITTLACWNEWFEKCAAQLCSDETKEAFSKFAQKRYKSYLDSSSLPSELQELIREDNKHQGVQRCWLDFEVSHWYKTKPSPKNLSEPFSPYPKKSTIYKKHLQERASHTPINQRLFLLEGNASNYIKDVCRKLKKFHHSDGNYKATTIEVQTDNNAMTLLDVVPDQHNYSAEDLLSAETTSKLIFDSLTEEQIHIWLAKLNHIHLNNPYLLDTIGIKKSALAERWKKTKGEVLQLIDRELGDASLSPYILIALREKLNFWSESHDTPYLTHLQG